MCAPGMWLIPGKIKHKCLILLWRNHLYLVLLTFLGSYEQSHRIGKKRCNPTNWQGICEMLAIEIIGVIITEPSSPKIRS
jgi:hypothetical protein